MLRRGHISMYATFDIGFGTAKLILYEILSITNEKLHYTIHTRVSRAYNKKKISKIFSDFKSLKVTGY